jgi:hypothetical protein
MGTARTVAIATLNDALRTTFAPEAGQVVTTPGYRSLPNRELFDAAIRNFAEFNKGNNPYGERDFGIVKLGEDTVMWKIDYYDTDCLYGSEDSADPKVTCRVLTLMLAEEY